MINNKLVKFPGLRVGCLKIQNVIQSPCQQIGQSETNLEEHESDPFSVKTDFPYLQKHFSLNFLLFISCGKQVLMLRRSREKPHLLSEPESESFSVIGKLVAPPFVGEKLINGKFYIINPNFDTKVQIINLDHRQM